MRTRDIARVLYKLRDIRHFFCGGLRAQLKSACDSLHVRQLGPSRLEFFQAQGQSLSVMNTRDKAATVGIV